MAGNREETGERREKDFRKKPEDFIKVIESANSRVEYAYNRAVLVIQ